jgi:hypothetical protein
VNAIFEYDNNEIPLSWHLTTHQKEDIQHGWERQVKGDQWKIVTDFVKNNLLPQPPAPQPVQ